MPGTLASTPCFLANVEVSHPGAKELLMLGAISVARSFTPVNRVAVDKTMEETFMRHAKSRTGGIGLTRLLTNYSAYPMLGKDHTCPIAVCQFHISNGRYGER